jgi:sirohydrochlorin ferrochelatase
MTTLLAVAHGTADPAGLAEVGRLEELMQLSRPTVPVELAWLERAAPSLPETLARLAGPVVVVPLLLSTGYHVKVDIQRTVRGRPETAVAGQLGPDRRITAVALERLLAGRPDTGQDVVLFSAGSSDPEAAEQLRTVAGELEGLLPAVTVYPRFLTDTEGWRRGVPPGSEVANYLLAPGYFNTLLQRRGAELGSAVVAAPIGAHPCVAAVAWDRYDQALSELPAASR